MSTKVLFWFDYWNFVSLFPAFENSSLETAKARLESMQIIAKHKRKAAEQAELEVLEAENNVEAIELEIEVIQRKGQNVSCDGFSALNGDTRVTEIYH